MVSCQKCTTCIYESLGSLLNTYFFNTLKIYNFFLKKKISRIFFWLPIQFNIRHMQFAYFNANRCKVGGPKMEQALEVHFALSSVQVVYIWGGGWF